MSSLTEEIKREIGQHFVFGFHGHEPSDDIVTLIRDYHLGHVIIFKRNIHSIPQLHGLIQKLQKIAKESGHAQPLMIGIDQENGMTSAFSSTAKTEAGTQFPGAMALAATGSVETAEQVAAATAREMRMAGINWAYSPVADVNSDYRNPVIGMRSFGDDAEVVGRFASAVSRGLTSEGIAPCAKHFPGHGDTHVDSHLSLPRIMKPAPALASTELVPFRALADTAIASIMTGHMALPLVTGDDTPCSLARSITTDLLRGALSFRGVVVTDCLEMEAVAAEYGAEGGAVRALQAGADVVMICHRMDRQRGAVEAAYAAVAAGTLSVAELQAGGERVKAFKARFAGSWDAVTSGELDLARLSALKRENARLSARAYASAIAWIRKPDAFRAVPAGGPIVLFTPQMESLNPAVDDPEGLQRTGDGKLRNAAGPSYRAFAASVAQRAPATHHIVFAPHDAIAGATALALAAAEAIIVTLRTADRAVWQIDYLRRLLAATGKDVQVVLVASCTPYDLVDAKDLDLPCIGTFEFTPPALEAAAAVLFRETKATGRVPVVLT